MHHGNAGLAATPGKRSNHGIRIHHERHDMDHQYRVEFPVARFDRGIERRGKAVLASIGEQVDRIRYRGFLWKYGAQFVRHRSRKAWQRKAFVQRLVRSEHARSSGVGQDQHPVADSLREGTEGLARKQQTSQAFNAHDAIALAEILHGSVVGGP